MKHVILTVVLAIACTLGHAQSTNPLNYGGRMYLESIEIISTPRYISYEDHAILSTQMRIPSTEITKVEFDFEKNTVSIGGTPNRIKVTSTKKYSTDYGWVVVIYADMIDEGDKMEIVWKEYGKPYAQQITKTNDGVKIARMNLSRQPKVVSEADAAAEMLKGLGTL